MTTPGLEKWQSWNVNSDAELMREPSAQRPERKPAPRQEAVAGALGLHSRGTQ